MNLNLHNVPSRVLGLSNRDLQLINANPHKTLDLDRDLQFISANPRKAQGNRDLQFINANPHKALDLDKDLQSVSFRLRKVLLDNRDRQFINADLRKDHSQLLPRGNRDRHFINASLHKVQFTNASTHKDHIRARLLVGRDLRVSCKRCHLALQVKGHQN